jgi:DNA-binding transcriptional LysR family regulator
VLADWSMPPADIYAIYPERLNLSAKVRVFIDFLERYLKRA